MPSSGRCWLRMSPSSRKYGGWGEADFTDVLHPAERHGSLHLRGEANWKKRREMRKQTATTKHAAQSPDEAGATPLSDARCVSGPCGVAPASCAMLLRQWFGPRRFETCEPTQGGRKNGRHQETPRKR